MLTSGNRNVIEKEAEEILKYRDIIPAIRCRWNVKTEVIPLTL